jgi:hypothetical protein
MRASFHRVAIEADPDLTLDINAWLLPSAMPSSIENRASHQGQLGADLDC